MVTEDDTSCAGVSELQVEFDEFITDSGRSQHPKVCEQQCDQGWGGVVNPGVLLC